LTPGQRSNAFFELIYGFLSDSKAVSFKAKAEELKTSAKIRETSFRLLERQLESLKNLLDVFQGFRGFLGRAGEDQEIICISDKSPVSTLDGLVQVVEHDIGDQGRDDAALRTSLSRDADGSILAYSCFEEGLDES
jgi:hypothetical protein